MKGKKIVLTGKFTDLTRKAAGDRLKAAGASVSGSISARSDALIAGVKAGSKLYKAYDAGVPILGEPHLGLLLGGTPFDEVVALARTFYTLDVVDEDPGGEALNRLGGPAPGFGAEDWPTWDGPMDHLFTLDLATMPALQIYYPELRTLSVFCSDQREVSMYDIGSPSSTKLRLHGADAKAVGRENLRPPSGTSDAASAWFRPVTHGWDAIDEHFGGRRVLGAVPLWCQGQEHQGNFLMQFGERFGVSGDGLIYMFSDAIFAQFT